MKAPLPSNEVARLEALRRYQILDTPAEQELDDITSLAAQICGTPTALITFIDAERQWFKSRYGWAEAEGSREVSFCAHAIVAADGGELVVPDATRDPRFSQNPYVTSEPPAVRFYAGVPLVTPDGHALGALCVIDRVPRTVSAEQLDALRALRRAVVRELELRKSRAELALVSKALERESEEGYRRFAESSPDAILIHAEQRIVFANRAMADLLGARSAADLVGRPSTFMLRPEYMALASERTRLLYAGEAQPRTEQLYVRSDGSEVNVEIAAAPFRIGARPAALVTVRDVSERYAAEQRVRAALNRFELVARATNDAVWDWDIAADTVWLSPTFYVLFGYRPDEIGSGAGVWPERIHPEDRERIAAGVRAAIEGEGETWTGEYRFRRGDGSYADIWDRGFVIRDRGKAVRMIGAMADQSRRKAAERALRGALDGLRHAQRMARLAHVITGPDGAFLEWSATLPEIVGLPPDRMPRTTRAWMALVHPDDRGHSRSLALLAAQTDQRQEMEYRLQSGDRGWVRVRQTVQPFEAGEGDAARRWFTTIQDVTEQRRIEESLRESESLQKAIVGASLDALVTIDHEGRIIAFNPAAESTFGLRRDQALGKPMADLIIPPRLRNDHQRGFARHLETGEGRILGKRLELQAMRADGSEFPVELAIIATQAGAKPTFTAFLRDITERKQAEEKIRRLNRVYAVLSGINALIVRVRERDELFREAARIAVETGGFRMVWLGVVEREADEVKVVASAGEVGDFFEDAQMSVSGQRPQGQGRVGRAIRGLKPVISNDVLADPDSPVRAKLLARGIASLALLPLVVEGRAIGVIALHAGEAGFFDEEEMKLLLELAGDLAFALGYIAKEERVRYLAYYDPLTGLANRALLEERLDQLLHSARRDQQKLALLIFDVERFKAMNEAFGRATGDRLLQEIAARMKSAAKDEARMARLGADHFAVMSELMADEKEIARLTETRLRQIFADPFPVGGQDLAVSARIGIAIFPQDGTDAEALLRSAEAALKSAKATGQRYLFFAPEMTARVADKLALESRLRRAVEKGELVLHYQPRVALPTGAIVGVEALIRWRTPDRGLVPPAQFVPLLEETGLILDAGRWALRQATLDHRAWTERGLRAPRVAVNVSAVQLRQRDFVATVERAIAAGATPTAIDLEITESLVMQDVEGNIEKLKALRALGMEIAIDDFGTGYSSLGYLAQLPVQSLKIDRSFIRRMQDEPNAMTLVATMISLARSLKLKVVAEGVETEEQAKFLRLLRCDEMQGYLFSRPVPSDELVELLKNAA